MNKTRLIINSLVLGVGNAAFFYAGDYLAIGYYRTFTCLLGLGIFQYLMYFNLKSYIWIQEDITKIREDIFHLNNQVDEFHQLVREITDLDKVEYDI